MAVEPGSRLYTGARPNALGFKCPRCGSVQTGDVQAGCTACGAGAVAPFRVRPVPMPGDGVEVEIDDQTGEVRALRPPPPPPTRLHTPTTLTEDLTRENFFVTADPVSPLDAIDDSPVETRPTTEYQTRISRESDGRWTVRVTDPITTLTADATDEIIPAAFAQAYEDLELMRLAQAARDSGALLTDNAQLLIDALTSHIDMYEKTKVAVDVGVPRAYELRDQLASLVPRP